MASFSFKPATRENVGLIIGVMGSSGSGKTYSAMRLASGLAGDKPFAVIDTESRRALHYADQFRFDHGELHAPFRPERYTEAIQAADKAGYPVIVVDSASHVWAGEGGVLDWQEEELERMAGQDWKRRESCKMAAWIKPKMGHKKMLQSLLQIRAHLILCFRAEEKIDMVREGGKTRIVPKQTSTSRDGWVPVCDKSLPYELTMSFLMLADAPGIPLPIKLQEQHRAVINLKAPVDEVFGRAIGGWAAGGETPKEEKPAKAPAKRAKEKPQERPKTEDYGRASAEERNALRSAAKVQGVDDQFLPDMVEVLGYTMDQLTSQQAGFLTKFLAAVAEGGMDGQSARLRKAYMAAASKFADRKTPPEPDSLFG